MTVLRRLRGVFGSALLWATTWGIAGGLGYAVAGTKWTLEGGRPLSISAVVPYIATGVLFLALYGALSGAAFAVVLTLVERRRTIHNLSIRRIATWGALGGITVLLLNLLAVYLIEGRVPSDTLPVLLIMSLLGAGCAAGSLALARRAPEDRAVNDLGSGGSEHELPGSSESPSGEVPQVSRGHAAERTRSRA